MLARTCSNHKPVGLAVRIREATDADLDVCLRVVNEVFTTTYGSPRYRSTSALLERIRSGCLLVVCEGSGSIVGCAEHKPFHLAEVLEFGPVAVLPHFQNHGLGAALVQEIEHRALLSGCHSLQVELRRQPELCRESLVRFYERRGYMQCGRRKRNYITMSKST